MRHIHQWEPLFQEPAYTVERKLQAIFARHSDYVQCACGQIGRKIQSRRGGIRILNADGQSRMDKMASEWILDAPEFAGMERL